MTKHINELYEIVQRSSSKEKQLDWSSVESRITDQVPLRAVTCVQIASKLISNYKVIQDFLMRLNLQKQGENYRSSSLNLWFLIDFLFNISCEITAS